MGTMDDWGSRLVNYFVHPFTIIATPVFLLLLTVFFVIQGFSTDVYVGIRSLAGALLPLILITFIHIFNQDLLIKLGNVNILISFSVSLVWGILIMAILHIFGSFFPLAAVPVKEVVLSGSFAILVYSYVQATANRALSYYYGMISGFLIYVIVFGIPASLLPK